LSSVSRRTGTFGERWNVTVDRKVREIFTQLAGARAAALDGSSPAATPAATLTSALLEEYPAERASDIAFHLTDWNSDAAFIVAALMFPDRFSANELREGVRSFLIHAPNHVAAAAKLGGWPIKDIFNVNVLDGDA
jgi:hypothetical protein